VISVEQQKDKQFFRLYVTHQRSVYAFIMANARNFNDANDIMQETAMIMWQKFDDLDKKEEKFLAWGILIARNQLYKYFARVKKTRLVFDEDLLRAIENQCMSKLESYPDHIYALQKCLSRLSEPHRQLLMMKFGQQLTIQTISEKLQRTVSAVYKTIARIHLALQQCIQQALSQEDHPKDNHGPLHKTI
jgi:RNA polymerase sigma-70 factor (ECF subfamily)